MPPSLGAAAGPAAPQRRTQDSVLAGKLLPDPAATELMTLVEGFRDDADRPHLRRVAQTAAPSHVPEEQVEAHRARLILCPTVPDACARIRGRETASCLPPAGCTSLQEVHDRRPEPDRDRGHEQGVHHPAKLKIGVARRLSLRSPVHVHTSEIVEADRRQEHTPNARDKQPMPRVMPAEAHAALRESTAFRAPQRITPDRPPT